VIIRVKLFAVAKQVTGASEIELEAPDGATVADVRDALIQQAPQLESMAGHFKFAINAAYASDSDIVPENAEVACIPPVSGG